MSEPEPPELPVEVGLAALEVEEVEVATTVVLGFADVAVEIGAATLEVAFVEVLEVVVLVTVDTANVVLLSVVVEVFVVCPGRPG